MFNFNGLVQRSTSNHTEIAKFHENSNHKRESSQTLHTHKRSGSGAGHDEAIFSKKAKMTPESKNSSGKKSTKAFRKKATMTSMDI